MAGSQTRVFCERRGPSPPTKIGTHVHDAAARSFWTQSFSNDLEHPSLPPITACHLCRVCMLTRSSHRPCLFALSPVWFSILGSVRTNRLPFRTEIGMYIERVGIIELHSHKSDSENQWAVCLPADKERAVPGIAWEQDRAVELGDSHI